MVYVRANHILSSLRVHHKNKSQSRRPLVFEISTNISIIHVCMYIGVANELIDLAEFRLLINTWLYVLQGELIV